MPDPIPCPKCGRLYVWDGTRCVNKYCRLGSTEKPLRQPKPPKKVVPVLPASFDVRWQSVLPMDVAAISKLLEEIKRNKYGWRVMVPVEFGNFFGIQVAIDFQTRPVPEKRHPPKVNEGEKDLAKMILLRLRDVLLEAEQRFESYNSNAPEAKGLVSNPHIWIDRDAIEEDGPNRWAFVVGAKGSPDFGWHVEFEGTKCLEIWGGDSLKFQLFAPTRNTLAAAPRARAKW